MVVEGKSAYEKVISIPEFWNGIIKVREGVLCENPSDARTQLIIKLAKSVKDSLRKGLCIHEIPEYSQYVTMTRSSISYNH